MCGNFLWWHMSLLWILTYLTGRNKHKVNWYTGCITSSLQPILAASLLYLLPIWLNQIKISFLISQILLYWKMFGIGKCWTVWGWNSLILSYPDHKKYLLLGLLMFPSTLSNIKKMSETSFMWYKTAEKCLVVTHQSSLNINIFYRSK